MGPVYLFAGSVSEALLRGIRQLGPDYAFSFESPQVDSREVALLPTTDPNLQPLSELGNHDQLGVATEDDEDGSRPTAAEGTATSQRNLHAEALSGTLSPRILLAFNPSVWGGEYFLDNTPEHNSVRWTNGGSHTSSGSSQGPERHQTMLSMAGSQAHVFVYPPAMRNCKGGDGNVHRGRPGHARGHSNRSEAVAGRSRIWSGYSASSGMDATCGENGGEAATSVRPRRRPGHMHAMRLPGTRECVRRDVRDALDCLGGVKVLLPLFAQYDHGVRRHGASRVSYQADPRLNETVLALLAGTLRDRCVYVSFFGLTDLIGCSVLSILRPRDPHQFSLLLHDAQHVCEDI